MELHSKVAIITGASSGIGKAIAQDLDAAGMNLVLTARSQDKLNQLAASLKNASVLAQPSPIQRCHKSEQATETAAQLLQDPKVVEKSMATLLPNA
jgi:NADP-dependent 3-hydroxy acid dehydrogenase YdfG